MPLGIVVDVHDDMGQLLLGADTDAAKGALEDGAHAAVVEVECPGVRIEHVGEHSTGLSITCRLRIGRRMESKEQVEVVGQEAVGEQVSGGDDPLLAQLQEVTAILVGEEDGIAIVATGADMIDKTRFHGREVRHVPIPLMRSPTR
jgi:hypothetical protein